MPLQNRVTPEGEIVATPERGLFMGNRGGAMHDGARRLTRRRWVSRAWITCLLEYRGWREVIMRPGRYTQLFFLDEATALAAGHRPCALCRRSDYNRFVQLVARSRGAATVPRAPEVDRLLHGERLAEGGGKRVVRGHVEDLPDGAFFRVGGRALLLAGGRAHPWTAAGYGEPTRLPSGTVEVLTPPSIVGVLRLGYAPVIHPSLRHS